VFRFNPDLPTGGAGGFTYNASVTLPNNAPTTANFGFVQLTNWNDTQNNAVSGDHTWSTNGFVLDNVPDRVGPQDPGYLYYNWTSPLMTAGQAVTTDPATQPHDYPHTATMMKAGVTDNAGTPNDWSLKLKVNEQFVTNLVYRPNPGIWVGLSTTPALSMLGEVTYDPNTKTFTTVSASPQQGGTLTGAANQAFVSWTGYFTTSGWNPPY